MARGRAEHSEALRQYLSAGGNVIDTSANYGLGDSELLCGEVLREFERDSVIVVTKAGYIQGHNKATAVSQGYPELVKFAPDVWHCIHPAFLKDQFELSCARLGVAKVDVFLLHNPEYFLKDAEQNGRNVGESRTEFYRRLQAAFGFFEELVALGRLDGYGVSSNSFGTPVDSASHVSLLRCCDAARSVSSTDHFRVAQLPLNLLETGPATLPVEEGQTVLEFARQSGIGVFTNRPLNAIVGGHLVRLADDSGGPEGAVSADLALKRLAEHEKSFQARFDFPLLGGGMGASGWLAPLRDHLPSLEEFRTAITLAFTPAANTWLLNADRTLQSDPNYTPWRAEFARRLDAVILSLQHETAKALDARAARVRTALAHAGLESPDHTLSQLALATVLNLPGVSCVLNGMRKPSYVEDSLGALDVVVPDARLVLERLKYLPAEPLD